ncbi:MAG: sigma 54-interacting transcriptional regulator [Planctomycetota bacterium]|jgi:hypothetical protein
MENFLEAEESGSLPGFFDLLDFDDDHKALHFNNRRQVMTDAGFLGVLHLELIRILGWRRTRGLLLRLGFSAGYADCQSLRQGFPWKNEKDLLLAGLSFHSMKGIVQNKLTRLEVDRARGHFLLEGEWENCLEAQWHQHLLGAAPAAVCWLQAGYLSGFGSAWWGDEILVREVECRGTGRTGLCRYEGRVAGDWGDEAQEDLDLLRYPSIGEELSKMGDLPSNVDAQGPSDPSTRPTDVFRIARKAGIIGRSKALEQCLKLATQVADTEATVLLVGESGTGKELFAHLIHEISHREKNSFVAVNCSALPEPLLESELFGHVKGSFTGAVESRKGLFEAAHGGTLLLDEIGEMTPATQVKLLRVLQDREVRPVGGNRGTPVDVRIVAATNRDLDRMVADGSFREDLYYRLKVFPIEIPTLRRRKEDVVPLARHFLARFSRAAGKKVNSLTPGALQALTAHLGGGPPHRHEGARTAPGGGRHALAPSRCGEVPHPPRPSPRGRAPAEDGQGPRHRGEHALAEAQGLRSGHGREAEGKPMNPRGGPLYPPSRTPWRRGR